MSMSCKKGVLSPADSPRRYFGVILVETQRRELSTNSTSCRGGCWPTWRQELLLRAALLRGKEAIAAWREWKSSVDVDRLDQGSRRLLPLLYRNLRAHGVEDPLMNSFKGIYRLTWYKNQMAFHKMTSLLRSFHHAGIETMLLKGAALVMLHYPSRSRPSSHE